MTQNVSFDGTRTAMGGTLLTGALVGAAAWWLLGRRAPRKEGVHTYTPQRRGAWRAQARSLAALFIVGVVTEQVLARVERMVAGDAADLHDALEPLAPFERAPGQTVRARSEPVSGSDYTELMQPGSHLLH